MKFYARTFISLFTFLFLFSCGGSSGSDTPSKNIIQPPSDTQEFTTSTGTITGFGSVFVNGVEYETSSSAITDDDNIELSEDDLSLGMIITIQGSINDDGVTGVANSISYSAEFKGYIDSIDLINSLITLHGQTIVVNELTHFDDTTFIALMTGDYIEVNGNFNSLSQLVATRIEKENVADKIKIKGYISNLDTIAMTFKIADKTVDYTSAELDDFDGKEIMNGQFVKVTAPLSITVSDNLMAIKVQLITYDDNSENSHEIEGIITNFTSSTSFMVNGISITTNNETIVEHGSLDQLQDNLIVEVTGKFDSSGVFLASEIEIEEATEIELIGKIKNIDYDNKTLAILGVTFYVSNDTRIEDDSDEGDKYLSFVQLNIDDFIEIKAFSDKDNLNIATKISLKNENESENDKIKLSGFVSDIGITNFTFKLMESTIFTNSDTEFEFNNIKNLTQAQFFEILKSGTNVKVEGHFDNGNFIAHEVESKE